jgi:hypothetical protein
MSRLSIPSRGNARAASRPKLGANRREYLNDVQAEAAVGRVGKVCAFRWIVNTDSV